MVKLNKKYLRQKPKMASLIFAVIASILGIPHVTFAQQANNPISNIKTDSQAESSIDSDESQKAEELAAPQDLSSNSSQIVPEQDDSKAQSQTDAQALPKDTQEQGPARRAFPTPLDSPPFPSGEWPIGGTNPIGVPDTSDTYLLMKALYRTKFGEYLKAKRIKIYGWADVGGNFSSSTRSNYPAAYPIFPHRVDLDQIALNIERIPDTVQTEHPDWGFRISNLYGIDYRFTTAKGYFSDQLLKKNRQYGYDPILFYFDYYLPKLGKGTNFRIGRFLSIPDIEAQMAPDNYMYTHSLMYTIDGYTQTGILASTKLSNQWTVQAGITGGNDVALWTRDVKPTGLAGLQWISKKNKDSLYLVANSFNDGRFAYNNIQEYNATWSHIFNKRLHAKTEAWYMYEKDVPASKLPIGICSAGKTCFTNEWAIVNYLVLILSKKNFLTLRNEYMNDIQGQRTGYATSYSSHGIGLTHWFNNWLAFRPEFRYERAYDRPAYNNGTRQNQFMFAADMIVRF